jgi:hypothetical protein
MVALRMAPQWALAISVAILGWTQMRNMCGLSHLGTITPLSSYPSLWGKVLGAYVVGGLCSSALVGAAVGAAGSLVRISGSGEILVYALPLCGVALMARELRLVRFPLAQCRRQTEKMWAYQFGVIQAAFMWGSHIGLTFATWMAYSGHWFVALAALRMGTPTWGAVLFSVTVQGV